MVVQTLAGAPKRAPSLAWAVPLIPAGVSGFCLSALFYYHLHQAGAAAEPSGWLQAGVAGLYSLIGFVPAVMLALLAFVWSTIWYVTGQIERPWRRLGRLLALAVTLSILVGLQPVEAASDGASGGWVGMVLAQRLESGVGYVLGTLVAALAVLLSLLLATDVMFYRYFEAIAETGAPRPRTPAEDGVEVEAVQEMKALALETDVEPRAARASGHARGSPFEIELPIAPLESSPVPAQGTAAADPDHRVAHPQPTSVESEAAEGAGGRDRGQAAEVARPVPLRGWRARAAALAADDEVEAATADSPAAGDAEADEEDDGGAEVIEAIEAVEAQDEEEEDDSEVDGEEEAADWEDEEEDDEEADDEDEEADGDDEDEASRAILQRSAGGGALQGGGAGSGAADLGHDAAGEPYELPRALPAVAARQGSLWGSADADDELIEDATELVRVAGRASITLLQRRLRIGVDEAGDVLECLRRRGIVGGAAGDPQGPVLIEDA